GISRIIEPFRGGTPSERDRAWKEPLESSGLFGNPRLRSFEWVHRLDAAGLLDRVLSISYVAALPEGSRERIAAEVGELARSLGSGELPYRTDVYIYERAP